MELAKRGCARCGRPCLDLDTPDRVLWLSYQDMNFHKVLPEGHSGESWVFGKDCHRAIVANNGVRDW